MLNLLIKSCDKWSRLMALQSFYIKKIASKFNDKVISGMLLVNDFTTTFGDLFRFIYLFFFSVT